MQRHRGLHEQLGNLVAIEVAPQPGQRAEKAILRPLAPGRPGTLNAGGAGLQPQGQLGPLPSRPPGFQQLLEQGGGPFAEIPLLPGDQALEDGRLGPAEPQAVQGSRNGRQRRALF
jgi:hypothetical protein